MTSDGQKKERWGMESDFTWTGEPPVIWDTLAKAEKERDEWKIRATEWLAVNELCARRVHAAEKRVAELEAQVAELVARAERNQGSADVLDEIEELMFGWEDDD